MGHSVGLIPQMRHSLVSFHEWAMHSWSLSANEPFRWSLIVAQRLCRQRKAAREAVHFWSLLRCLSVSRSLSITAGLFPSIRLFPQISHWVVGFLCLCDFCVVKREQRAIHLSHSRPSCMCVCVYMCVCMWLNGRVCVSVCVRHGTRAASDPPLPFSPTLCVCVR